MTFCFWSRKPTQQALRQKFQRNYTRPLSLTRSTRSYNLNGTGPASILASYNFERTSLHQGSLSEEEHVQKAVDIMVEIHGDVAREQYTGNSRRVCSHHNEFRIGAYTSPMAGQMKLYIPEYFKTHSNVSLVCGSSSHVGGVNKTKANRCVGRGF